MASVQELLAAAQTKKSPFLSLLEGVTSGVGSAQTDAMDQFRTGMALQQAQEERQRRLQNDQRMQSLLTNQTDQKLQGDLEQAGGPSKALTPAMRLVEATTDEKGYLRPKFEVVQPKPKALQSKEYQDASGANRIGSYDANTGKFIQSPNDPLAPKTSAELGFGEKQDQYNQKRLTALGDALDPSKARAGAFGVSKQVFDRAERLKTLASAFPDGNLDSRQIEELAIGLNAMLSGANAGAQRQVEALVPSSIVGNGQKLAEWLTNEPHGTNQVAFVQRMLGSIDREQSTAADQIKRTQMQRVARYADLERSSPDAFYNVLESAGLDPQEYKKWRAGGYKPMSAVQAPEGVPPAGTRGGTHKIGRFTVEVQ
jgi:hypothetical protein